MSSDRKEILPMDRKWLAEAALAREGARLLATITVIVALSGGTFVALLFKHLF